MYWIEVISGIPKGTMLVPIMLLMYINNINDSTETDNHVNLLAVGGKIHIIIKDESS